MVFLTCVHSFRVTDVLKEAPTFVLGGKHADVLWGWHHWQPASWRPGHGSFQGPPSSYHSHCCLVRPLEDNQLVVVTTVVWYGPVIGPLKDHQAVNY